MKTKLKLLALLFAGIAAPLMGQALPSSNPYELVCEFIPYGIENLEQTAEPNAAAGHDYQGVRAEAWGSDGLGDIFAGWSGDFCTLSSIGWGQYGSSPHFNPMVGYGAMWVTTNETGAVIYGAQHTVTTDIALFGNDIRLELTHTGPLVSILMTITPWVGPSQHYYAEGAFQFSSQLKPTSPEE